MPNFLAATKWPLSCSITENSRANRKMSQPSRSTRGSSLPVELPCPCPRPSVHREHVFECGHCGTRRVVLRDYPPDGVNDPGERDPSREEISYACLVGAVVDGGRGPAEPGCLAGQRNRRKRLIVQG